MDWLYLGIAIIVSYGERKCTMFGEVTVLQP
jgi:hypothetical protein